MRWVTIGMLGVACGGDPSGPVDRPRVLEGPLVGAALVATPGTLWTSAPGIEGDGGVYAFAAPAGDLVVADADVSVLGGATNMVGASFAPCADIGGDGVPDLLVGAPLRGQEGGTWIVSGPLAGSITLGTQPFVPGDETGEQAGAVVGCGTIVPGEPEAVALASPSTDRNDHVTGTGKITLYDAELDRVAVLQSTFAGSHLGFRTSLLVGVDMDQDGIGDVVSGAWGADLVHVMRGPFAGTLEANDSGPLLTGDTGDGTGYALAAGDFDGDGALDLAIGIPHAVGDQGGVWIQNGPFDETQDGLISTRARRIDGVQTDDQAGFALAAVPDVDGDGDDELLVGAPFAMGVGPETGAAYLLLGPVTNVSNLEAADAILLGDTAYGRFGWALTAGDVDADGAPDLAIAAPEADVGDVVGAGAVHVFPASVRGVVYPDRAFAHLRAQ
jgi:hypothetical protein